MSFLETVEKARAFLERNGRVSLRALQREFNLDDDALDELIEELAEIQRVAVRDGRALAWAGGVPPAPTEAPARERNPRDYTPKHLADKILQSKSALEGERKQVTVLFADVKGSMELAEQVDPEEWHRILDRFFQILADGIHRFEGTVNQYTGDGIMALFGAPIAHEDHAQRACYAALHLREALRSYADQIRLEQGLNFSVRMGINSGEVVVGKIGDDLRMDYTAQGQVVNLAARIEQLAEPGRIYTAKSTAGQASGYFRLRDLGQAKVKGSADPVHVFDLEGIGEFHTRFDVSRARGLAKFVGRDREVFRLEAALERARAGQPQLVGIVAEAGTGKSRLAYEFCERCRGSRVPVDQASCQPHGRSIPLGFHMSVMRSTFGILDRDDDETARNKVAGQMVRLDPSLGEDVPFMLDFLGIAEPAQRSPVSDPEARQREFLRVVERIVRARLGEVRVWLLEDLHWIDPASEAVDLEVVRIQDKIASPVLKLMTFRPEYRPPHADRPNYEEIRLKPLGSEATAELLADLLGPEAPAGELEALVQERAGGNPFFLEEIVQSLVESGHLEGSRGAYRLVRSVETIEIPSSVQAVLAARIDRLSERAKQVLYTAAVVGSGFPLPLLEGALGAPAGSLDAVLYELASADFIYQESAYPEVEYAFKHPLTQEVAYGSQLGERRARVHAAVARAIERLDADKLDERAALLAHHWEQAGESLAAARWHHRAARWMFRREPVHTLEHAQKVRELLVEVPESPETLELRIDALRFILVSTSHFGLEEAEFVRLVEEGNALLSRSGDARAHALFLMDTGSALAIAGRLRAALPPLEQAVARADEIGDAELRAAARSGLTAAHVMGGSSDRVLAVTDEAVEILGGAAAAEANPSPMNPYHRFLSFRGWALALSGRLGEARAMLDRALELTVEQGHLVGASVIHFFWTYLEGWRGSPSGALAHARQSVEIAERMGVPTRLALAYEVLGRAHLSNGQLEEARAVLEHALAIVPGFRSLNSWVLPLLAEACAGLGDFARAREAAAEAVALADREGVRLGSIPLSLARVLRSADGLAAEREIEAALDRALELVEETGSRVFVPQIHEERAELARLRGDEATRERELREAHRLYTEMGATGHAERLAKELGL